MKKYKLTIKPAIEPEERHKIEKALKVFGFEIHGGGSHVDGSSCDISFSRMEDWQQRVVVERDELQNRIDKLEVFMTTQVYAELEPQKQILLDEQLQAMYAYRLPLMNRILLF